MLYYANSLNVDIRPNEPGEVMLFAGMGTDPQLDELKEWGLEQPPVLTVYWTGAGFLTSRPSRAPELGAGAHMSLRPLAGVSSLPKI